MGSSTTATTKKKAKTPMEGTHLSAAAIEASKVQMNRPLQGLFALACLVPPLAAALVDPAGLAEVRGYVGASLTEPNYLSPLFLAACCLLAVERVCYTVVWCFPKAFLDFCAAVKGTALNNGDDSPVDVIVKLFFVNKLCQYGGFAFLYLSAGPLPNVFRTTSTFAWVVGLQLLALGQLLNVAIYRAIGKNGVYYGCKFGKTIPWCYGFPFNVVTAHPQYLGSVMTSFGAALILATPSHVAKGWLGLSVIQALQYFYMAYVEHNL